MSIPRETIQHLRQGGWVHWERPDGDLFIHILQPELALPPGTPGLVAAEAGTLGSYVTEISDLMWDVMEYTDKELWLLVPQGRNLPEGTLQADGSLWLHWAKDGVLNKLVQPMGRPALVVRATTPEEIKGALGALENVVTLPPQKGADRRAMRMAPDGSVQMMD